MTTHLNDEELVRQEEEQQEQTNNENIQNSSNNENDNEQNIKNENENENEILQQQKDSSQKEENKKEIVNDNEIKTQKIESDEKDLSNNDHNLANNSQLKNESIPKSSINNNSDNNNNKNKNKKNNNDINIERKKNEFIKFLNGINLNPSRDMIGYGHTPPKVLWPNGARICVSFVLNYEEGGEQCLLNGDNKSESYLCEHIPTVSIANGRNLSTESQYEYGSRAGIWRVLRILHKYNIKCTVFAVGKAIEENPVVIQYMHRMGHDIASHQYRWGKDYRDIANNSNNFSDEENDLVKTINIHKKTIQKAPNGLYVGTVSKYSKYLAYKYKFKWISDCYDDDLPYWDNHSNSNNPLLVIPYSLDTNDYRYLIAGNGFRIAADFYNYCKDAFEVLYEEGGKMMSIGLHSRIIGHPGRIKGLEWFLRCITGNTYRDRVWIANRSQIYDFWKNSFTINTCKTYREKQLKQLPSQNKKKEKETKN